MTSPHDWPTPGGTAGGCACDYCGVIYIGPEWEDGCCAVCARDSDAGLAEDAKRLSGEAVAARAEGIAQGDVA